LCLTTYAPAPLTTSQSNKAPSKAIPEVTGFDGTTHGLKVVNASVVDHAEEVLLSEEQAERISHS
jgi:hypothetical protein